MDDAPRRTLPAPAGAGRREGAVLAVTSAVLGILALLTSPFVVGAFFGLIGAVLGGIHLALRRTARGMAWTGVALSGAGVVATAVLVALYFAGARAVTVNTGASQDGGLGPEPLGEWIGRPAPEVTLTALDGSRWTLSELRGRPVVIDFWATWCPPCVKEIPHFVRLRREVSTNDLVVLGVSGEHAGILQPFLRSRGVNYPIVSSAGVELPPPFGSIQGLPTTFFLDRHGRIRDVAVGYTDFDGLRRSALAAEQGSEPEGKPGSP